MQDLLQDPLVRGIGLPFAAALLLALLARAGGGATVRYASLAIPAAFVATYLLQFGLPPLPPVSAQQKIPYAVAGLALLGVALDARLARPWALAVLGGVGIGVGIGWLAYRRLAIGDTEAWILAGALAGGALLALLPLAAARTRPAAGAAAVAAAGLGLAGIALLGASASIAQAAIALAAAAGGFALLNLFRPLVPLGPAGIIGAVGALALLAAQSAFFARLDRTALAMLAASIPMLWVASRTRYGRGTGPTAAIAVGVAAGIPAAGAVAFVWFTH